METYDALLDAAENVVIEKGSANLTLELVAKKAKVSKGGLLYHFPSKKALIQAMIHRMIERFDKKMEKQMEKDMRGPGKWVRAYIQSSIEPTGIGKKDLAAAGLLAAIATDPQLLEPLYQRYNIWRKKIADDQILVEDAWILTLAVDGLWLSDLMGFQAPKGKIRKRILQRMIDLSLTEPKS